MEERTYKVSEDTTFLAGDEDIPYRALVRYGAIENLEDLEI